MTPYIICFLVAVGISSLALILFGIYYTLTLIRQSAALDQLAESCAELKIRLKDLEAAKTLWTDHINMFGSHSLTDKGKLLLYISGGLEFNKAHKMEMIYGLQKHKPKNLYDVAFYSERQIYNMSKEDNFNKIKNYAFKNGLDLDLIIKIMAVDLKEQALMHEDFRLSQE